MWIKRERYEELLREISGWKVEAARNKAEAEGATRLTVWTEAERSRLQTQVEAERVRAENAVDELLKLKAEVNPVSPHSFMRKQESADITDLDNIFEEEDPEAVKRLVERMETEGPGTIYTEALEEMSE